MRSRRLLIVLGVFALVAQATWLQGSGEGTRNAAPAGLKIRFEELAGGDDSQTRFISRGSGFAFEVAPSGYELALRPRDQTRTARSGIPTSLAEQACAWMLSNHQPPPPATERLRASLVNASDSASCRGEELLPGRTNYLIGNDPSKWRRNVRHYARVRCEQVYAGIDVVYYGGDKGMEFDFVVAPNADASQARMSFDGGVRKLETSEIGHLRLHTAAGLVVQRKPVAYQEVEGERVEVAADYVLQDDNRAAFRLGEYNPALPLVIDPVLDWATFLGGSGDDGIQNISADDQGNVYVVGRTASANFPTAGPYQGALSGPGDIFVAKLSPDGSQLIFATYLGGSGLDLPGGIAVDSEGNVYVSGGTTSADFPATAGSVQPDFGGAVDAFVAKLNPQGSDLIYATFLGGGALDIGAGLRLDESNHAYVIGSTDGEGFPVTEGVLQSTYGGQFDTFVSKLDPAGATLVYSTLFGGNGSEIPADVELNAQGEVHIAGIASSTDFPGTPGAYQEAIVAGTFDAFVAKFNAAGTKVEYLSFLGGSGRDEASGLSLDSLNNVWLSGGTDSNDFPTTEEAPNPNYLGGDSDGFLARLPLPRGMLLGPEQASRAKGGSPYCRAARHIHRQRIAQLRTGCSRERGRGWQRPEGKRI